MVQKIFELLPSLEQPALLTMLNVTLPYFPVAELRPVPLQVLKTLKNVPDLYLMRIAEAGQEQVCMHMPVCHTLV